MPDVKLLYRISFAIIFTAILFSCWLMVKITVPYFSFEYDIGFLLTKQAILHNTLWRWSFYIHISTSILVLLAGLLQFIKPLLYHYPGVHRMFGNIYIVLVIFLAAPSGLVMAFYANGGFWAKTSFVLISAGWWMFTFIAYRKIRQKNISGHINFMIRSYALTLSAISLRTYVVLLPGIIPLHGKEMYVLVAWLSWVPNLIIAELLIRMKAIK